MSKSIKVVSLIICSILFFCSCSKIEDAMIKMGLKNLDFEIIKEGNIKEIIIQNTRDKSFTFIVQDKNTILEFYDIFSKAKTVENKIDLKPDYTITLVDEDSNLYEYHYISGLDKTELGNLYNDDKNYIVSKRLDNDIINYFFNIRKPNKFKEVYYDTITMAIETYREEKNYNDLIGVNIYDDIESSKFLLSLDIEEFKQDLGNENIILENETYEDNISLKIITDGYKSNIYKCRVEFYNKEENNTITYYFIDNYIEGNWKLNLYYSKPDEY